MTEIFIHFTNSTPNKNERVSPMKQPLVLYQNGYSEAGPHDAWKLFVCLGLEESKYKKKGSSAIYDLFKRNDSFY